MVQVQGVRKTQLKSGQTVKLATLSSKTLPRFATCKGGKCLNLFQVKLSNAERLNLKCVLTLLCERKYSVSAFLEEAQGSFPEPLRSY